jgi:3-hydroxyisobutyrate dehydrogenase
MRTAVLGTGIMGAAMARTLAREGHDVAVWNRTPARAEAVSGDGITAYADLADAVAGAEVVVTMVYDADSVLDLAADLVAALEPDAVWVQSTTVGPAGMARIAEAAGEVADRLLDAPVLGTKQPAETGNLIVLLSGPPAARERAGGVLEAVGSRTLVVGDELGAASALKLVCNSWVASINAATAQAVGLAQSLGLDPRLFLEGIRGGAADSAYAQVKGGLMIDGSWDDPSFALDSVRKDVGLMLDAAHTSGFPDDLLATLLALYDRASERGLGGADMAAVRGAFETSASTAGERSE